VRAPPQPARTASELHHPSDQGRPVSVRDPHLRAQSRRPRQRPLRPPDDRTHHWHV